MSAKEPVSPNVDAPTLAWFTYYRNLETFHRNKISRLETIERAAIDVSNARRNGVVTDQPSLDTLDVALLRRPHIGAGNV